MATRAYYLDVQNEIRDTSQPAASGLTHRLVGEVVQVIAWDGEVVFEHQAWFDRDTLTAVIKEAL